jgi:hypothetical protein
MKEQTSGVTTAQRHFRLERQSKPDAEMAIINAHAFVHYNAGTRVESTKAHARDWVLCVLMVGAHSRALT